MAVRDLDRSVAFYRDVTGMPEQVRDGGIAVLGSDRPGSLLLVLREADRAASKHGYGELGVRAVCFAVNSTDELDGVQSSLQRAESFRERRQIDGVDVVVGRDPDGLPVIFMVHGPTVGDVEHYRRAAMLLYTVDV